VEKQPGSVSKLQIELPADEVAKEWDAIANSFARFAENSWIPAGQGPARGDRQKDFARKSRTNSQRSLSSKSYHEAIEREQLRVASVTKH